MRRLLKKSSSIENVDTVSVLYEKIVFLKKLLPAFIAVFCYYGVQAQQISLQGRVFDHLNLRPLEGVLVISNGKIETITDSSGKYSLVLSKSDSVSFSFQGKSTMKYAVDTISNPHSFDLAIHVKVHQLPNVTLKNSDYRQDSVLNRETYAKYFNYKKPGISFSAPNTYVPGALTVGIDLQELINAFRFKRNQRLESLQKRLIQQEQDKYIFHRFNKRFIRQLTNVSDEDLNYFMEFYKPAYHVLLTMNDIELGYYIQQCFKHFIALKKTSPSR